MTAKLTVRSVCPHCRASRFQGPYHRGDILNGKFVPREEIYECVFCHKAIPVAELCEEPLPDMKVMDE
jgi:hypothetical protein